MKTLIDLIRELWDWICPSGWVWWRCMAGLQVESQAVEPLVRDGGFEANWGEKKSHRCMVFPEGGEPYEKDVGNIFVPPDWIFWFRHDPGKWDQPEGRDAHRIHDPHRVHSGAKAYMYFTFFRRHDAGLYQQVEVEPGQQLRLTAWAHAWSNTNIEGHEACFERGRCSCGVGTEPAFILEGDALPPTGDPWSDAIQNFSFYVGIDPTGGTNPFADTVVWGRGAHIYNTHARVPAVEAVAQGSTVTVFLRSKTKWPFKHNDAYWDDAELEVVGDPEPPPPPPPAPEGATKLGAHVLRTAADLGDFIQARPAVVKLVGDWGLAASVPEGTLVIGAKAGQYDAQSQRAQGKTPFEAAQQFVNDMKQTYLDNPLIKYWEGHNEPVWVDSEGMGWYAQFEIERMKLMAGLGFKCVIGSFSTGCPPLELWPAFVPAIREGLKYEAILGLHEYSCPWMWWMTGSYQLDPGEDQGDEGWTTLRYRKVYRQYLTPNGVGDIPLVITETGLDPLVNPKPPGVSGGAWKQLGDFWAEHDNEPDKADYYFRQLLWYDAELQKDDYVVGATIFTWGNWGSTWEKFDVAGTDVAKKLVAHTAEHPAVPFVYPTDPDPVPPPPPDGLPRVQYERAYVLLPPGATLEWALAAMAGGWDAHRYTIGGSADDAGLGALQDKTVLAVNPHLWADDLAAFFEEHYPGVDYQTITVDTPEELERVLSLPDPTGGEPHDPIMLCMRDPRWAGWRYCGGQCATIGEMGCWLTVSAMAQRWYGIDPEATPVTVDEAVGPSGYTNCEMRWDAMPGIGLNVIGATMDVALVKARLDAGDVVFAEVLPGPPKHFVMVTRYEGERFWAYDPLAYEPGWLDERYASVESWRLLCKVQVEPALLQVGLHDAAGAAWMAAHGMTGVALAHVAVQREAVPLDFTAYERAGIGVYLRINWGYADGTGTLPPPEHLAAWISAVAETVWDSRGLAGVHIGNEANNPAEWCGGWPNPTHILTPRYYVNAYNAICTLLADCPVSLAPFPLDPYNVVAGQFGVEPDPRGWARYVYAEATRVDWIAMHAKTQGAEPVQCWSEERFADAPLVGRFLHLRTLEDQLSWIPMQHRGKPILVTELNPQRRRDGALGWDSDGAEWVKKALAYVATLPEVRGLMLYRFDAADPWGLETRLGILEALKQGG